MRSIVSFTIAQAEFNSTFYGQARSSNSSSPANILKVIAVRNLGGVQFVLQLCSGTGSCAGKSKATGSSNFTLATRHSRLNCLYDINRSFAFQSKRSILLPALPVGPRKPEESEYTCATALNIPSVTTDTCRFTKLASRVRYLFSKGRRTILTG